MNINNVNFSNPYVVKHSNFGFKGTVNSEINIKNLYSQKEQKEIIDKFDFIKTSESTKRKFVPDFLQEDFEWSYNPKNQTMTINNTCVTNHTLVIHSDGTAENIGSWNRNVLEENYKDIYDDLITRIANKNNVNSDELNAQLDALAQLGKGSIK